MIDTTLIDRLKILADKETKIKEYKKRFRVKGNIIEKGTTRKGNITLTLGKEEDIFKITVLKTHKERYALAEKLAVGRSVSVEGISKFRVIICTRLKTLDRAVAQGKQEKLESYWTG